MKIDDTVHLERFQRKDRFKLIVWFVHYRTKEKSTSVTIFRLYKHGKNI